MIRCSVLEGLAEESTTAAETSSALFIMQSGRSLFGIWLPPSRGNPGTHVRGRPRPVKFTEGTTWISFENPPAHSSTGYLIYNLLV